MSDQRMINYKAALQDLKKLNDDLFYNDLKKEIKNNLQMIQNEAEKHDQKLKETENLIEGTTSNLVDNVKKATIALHTSATILDEKLVSSFTEQDEKIQNSLSEVFNIFLETGEEQRKFVEKDFFPKINSLISQLETMNKQHLLEIETLLMNQNKIVELERENLNTHMSAIHQSQRESRLTVESFQKQYSQSQQKLVEKLDISNSFSRNWFLMLLISNVFLSLCVIGLYFF